VSVGERAGAHSCFGCTTIESTVQQFTPTTMPSLRNAIQNAVDRKVVPPHQAGSTRDLALAMGMTAPISVIQLIGGLEGLPPATVIFDSGTLGPSTVTASAQVGIQSDGLASFRGNIHESGAIGHNYVFAIALLDLKDSQGNTLVFAHEGNVKGQLDIGSSDDSWQDDGHNSLISDNWDIAKNSRSQARLHVSTDPLQAIETVIIGLFAAVGTVAVALFTTDPNTVCTWRTTGDPQGGAAVDLVCRQEFR